MHKVCGIFSVLLAVVFATVTLGAMPAAAAPKSAKRQWSASSGLPSTRFQISSIAVTSSSMGCVP